MKPDDLVTVDRALVAAFGNDAMVPLWLPSAGQIEVGRYYGISHYGADYVLKHGTETVAQNPDLNVVVAALVADIRKGR